ncbi:MAG: argininosuccinate synthase [Candidatus Micrarchaeota archaeon]|nr:argininosuccinate synthase [Candidatus Micrarchaeota archaeon]MDE1834786.1 argininosuccinate synthase [Candidatus Micrarchaeota archaeon]MDE1859553.1 argininosuccinate synthase [Candidatus Micrarchaeota archaeon]
MAKDKVVLAYSGGLDTSVILRWLVNKGYEVICFVGDLGQNDDLEAIKKKAMSAGASKVYIKDLKSEFVTDFIFPAMQCNALYEGRYLLGTSLARPLLAKAQMEIAKKEGAKYVSHGATGKGNDQVRFELAYYALDPKIKVIAPWKDKDFLAQFKGRSDLIAYARKYGIPVKATTAKPYSEDENLMHISHEAGILEDPGFKPPEHVFSRTASIEKAPSKETVLELIFKDGIPVKLVDKTSKVMKTRPLDIFLYLNKVGSINGIGRVDMVENRYVGIKSRGVYETPGATILWAAHRDLEGIAMDKEVMHIRDSLMPKFAEIVYNGFWFSPEMDFLMNAFKKSQEAIDGKVTVSLLKGNVMITGRESFTPLYNQKLSSMDEEGGFNATDSRGFINVNAIRLKAHNIAMKGRIPFDALKKKSGKNANK